LRELITTFFHGGITGVTFSDIDHVKDTYLSGSPDGELPQLNQILRAEDPAVLLNKAAKQLNCDIDFFKTSGVFWAMIATNGM